MTTFPPIIFPEVISKDSIADLLSSLNRLNDAMKGIMDRGVQLADNVDCRFTQLLAGGVANVETILSHDLGKIPTGYIIYNQNQSATLYATNKINWSSTQIGLWSSVANVTYDLIIF